MLEKLFLSEPQESVSLVRLWEWSYLSNAKYPHIALHPWSFQAGVMPAEDEEILLSLHGCFEDISCDPLNHKAVNDTGRSKEGET